MRRRNNRDRETRSRWIVITNTGTRAISICQNWVVAYLLVDMGCELDRIGCGEQGKGRKEMDRDPPLQPLFSDLLDFII